MAPVINLWTNPFPASISEDSEKPTSTCQKTTGAKLSSVVERLWQTKQQRAQMADVGDRVDGAKRKALGRAINTQERAERNKTRVPQKTTVKHSVTVPMVRRKKPPSKETEKTTSSLNAEKVAGKKTKQPTLTNATRSCAPKHATTAQAEIEPTSHKSLSKSQMNVARNRRRKVLTHEQTAERQRRRRRQREAQSKKSPQGTDEQVPSGGGGINELMLTRSASGKMLERPLKNNVTEAKGAQRVARRVLEPPIAPPEAAPASQSSASDDEPLVLTERDLAEMGFPNYEVFIEPVSDEESSELSVCESGDTGRNSAGKGAGDTLLRRLSARDKRVPKRFGDNNGVNHLESSSAKRPPKDGTKPDQELLADWNMYELEVVIEHIPDDPLQLTEEQQRVLGDISLALSEIVERDIECMVTAWVELGMTAKSMGVSEFSLPKHICILE